jgi:large subunit ribosomal protein L25
MKTIEIKGSLRTELGKKSSKQIRKADSVPCVIYGEGENIHFLAPELSFKNLVYTHEVHLVDLNVDGKIYKTILQDIQFHPVSDKIIHIDFIKIFDDKPVAISVPVSVSGNSPGVIAGGKLSVKRRTLKIKGLPKNLPESISIDISNLNIHESVKVSDLSVDNIEFLDMKKTVIVTVATSRGAKTAEATTAAAATK